MTSVNAVDYIFSNHNCASQSPFLGYEEMFELLTMAGAKVEKGSFDLRKLDCTSL